LKTSQKERRRITTEEADRSEVFRGHLGECLDHLGKILGAAALKGTPQAVKLREPIAEFCGVLEGAVARWFRDRKPPLGEVAIRLTCYLDLIGYRVIGLSRMNQARRGLIELIGYRLLSLEEVAKLLQYSEPQTLLRVLHGNAKPSKERDRLMFDIWKERKEDLEKKKAKAFDKYALNFNQVREAISATAGAESVSADVTTTPRRVVRRPSFALLMEALLVMMEEGALKDLSPEAIRELHDSGVSHMILRLSSRLSEVSARLVTTPPIP